MADIVLYRYAACCLRLVVPVLVGGLLTAPVMAAEPDAATIKAISENLGKISPDIMIDDIRETPLPELYEVRVGMEILYVSGDGRFAFRGDLYDLGKQANISEGQRETLRSQRLGNISSKDWIEFAPEQEKTKHTVYVFTDVNCSYCRRMHSEIKQINDLGIAVRYLAFPIIGEPDEAQRSMEAVWCSKDRQAALTLAKSGRSIAYQTCVNPVNQMKQLGLEIGVRGTPAIYLPNGRELPGYMSHNELFDFLEKAGS